MPVNFALLADFPFAAEIASKQASDIDSLWWFLCIVSLVMTVLIFVGVVFFAVKYRKRPGVVATQIEGSTFLEVTWSIIPFLVMLVMFWWGADLFYAAVTPPKDAMEVFVTGKQWMWKVQYPNGYREIDALHVPVGQPVKLTLASEDVIHSFSVPAFRVRHDVVPGTYDTLWFTPSKAGTYHIFCTEYCGNQHAHMIGWVTVMERNDWEAWSGGGGSGASLAQQGEQLFGQNGCSTCHLLDQQGRCPILRGLYNKPVQLNDGRTVIADDAYLRESILQPNAKIVSGFEANIMPNFQGQLSEEQVIQLIAYIKSLSPTTPASQQGSQQPAIVIAPKAKPASAPAPAAAPPASSKPAPTAPQPVRIHMATLVTSNPQTPDSPFEETKLNYLNVSHGWKSWLFTVDHKRIALLYLFSITLMFFVGGTFAVLVRLHLTTPTGLFPPEVYNRLFSMHGIVMVFFFLVPSIPATLGNFLLPIMIGAKDLAFPRINLLSWYIYILGAIMALYAVARGGVDTGWTFYTPYSTTYSNSYVLAAALGVFVAGFSSILTGLNFIVTVHKMRAPGMSWGRMPLFVWAHYATGLIQILGTPVVAIALLLVALERVMHVGIFDPTVGGDPILFQHIFWFYSHPAVYIMILPGMGVISEVIACFSKKRIFGYDFIAASSMGIAVLGFLVWGHHMFITGESMYTGIVFSFLSFFVAVPSAIKVFNWTATMYKGSVTFDSPMLYAFGFIGLFTIGGLTGLFLSTLATNVALHGTYFVVAHFHFVMVGGMVVAFMSGLHFWWPKITGRMYNEGWAKFAALLVFVGFNLTFLPQFVLGYLGMPRRYSAYPPEFQVLNVLSSAGASVLGLAFLIPMIYLSYSWFFGPKVGKNPWQAAGLEWQIDSPPITLNFDKTPIVTEEAYNYGPLEEVVG